MDNTLRLFAIGLFSTVLFISGCSGGSNSGVNKDPIEDIDGDGIADIVDPDIDGDGIPNADDPDDDNDGVEDSVDPTPPVKPGTKTCTAARILPPEGDDHKLGDIGELGWELLPTGCVLPVARAAGQGVPVSATKDDDGEVSNATAKAGNCDGRTPEQVQCGVDIEIPRGCGATGEEVADVTYDISQIGIALGDIDLSKGEYEQTNKHRMPKCPDPSFSAATMRPLDVKTVTDANGYTTVFPEGQKVTIFQRGSSDSLCDLKDPRSFFDVTSNSTLYPNGYLNVYLKDCPSDRLTVEPGRSNGTYYFGNEGSDADNFTSWQDVQQSDKYKDCKVNINAFPCTGCVAGYALQLDPAENPAIEFTVKKFRVEEGGGGACGAGGEEGAGGSEPTFRVGNGEIETRASTECDINSSGAHDCIATEKLRGVDEYFLVSYGVDGATQLKYFNQPSWSFNPGPGSNPSQKMAVLISEKRDNCPSLGFDAQINQISG